MRGKRAKTYRKLMQQYGLTFGFREPYQVLVDAQMIQDAESFKMDLVGGLERTLSGKVKPMITQCSIRHLYSLSSSEFPSSLKETLIATAKTMERRRCNHHELEEPLATLDCLSSVIDPKGSGTNKHCYLIASQEEAVRRYCRGLRGVPLIYVKRSVMVMEPMSEGSIVVREKSEKEKFREGLRGRVAGMGKRKRDDEDRENIPEIDAAGGQAVEGGQEPTAKKKRIRGPKGPNPLSVKKPKGEAKSQKAKSNTEDHAATIPTSSAAIEGEVRVNISDGRETNDSRPTARKKKRRRQRAKPEATSAPVSEGEVGDKI